MQVFEEEDKGNEGKRRAQAFADNLDEGVFG